MEFKWIVIVFVVFLVTAEGRRCTRMNVGEQCSCTPNFESMVCQQIVSDLVIRNSLYDISLQRRLENIDISETSFNVDWGRMSMFTGVFDLSDNQCSSLRLYQGNVNFKSTCFTEKKEHHSATGITINIRTTEATKVECSHMTLITYVVIGVAGLFLLIIFVLSAIIAFACYIIKRRTIKEKKKPTPETEELIANVSVCIFSISLFFKKMYVAAPSTYIVTNTINVVCVCM